VYSPTGDTLCLITYSTVRHIPQHTEMVNRLNLLTLRTLKINITEDDTPFSQLGGVISSTNAPTTKITHSPDLITRLQQGKPPFRAGCYE